MGSLSASSLQFQLKALPKSTPNLEISCDHQQQLNYGICGATIFINFNCLFCNQEFPKTKCMPQL
jgi:hypothetical protein